MTETDKTVEFLKNTTAKDGVVIIFNNDSDGIASCLLVMKTLEKNGVKKPFIIAQPMPPEKNLIKRVQTSLPNKMIFLDMAIDQKEDVVKKLKGICDILIIDHHQVFKNLNSGNVVHYNPRFRNPKIYQSTSYLAYKICSRVHDISQYLWVAAIGMVADYDLSHSKELVDEVKNRYGHDAMGDFSMISFMIESSRATKKMTCEEIVNVLARHEDYKEFLESKDAEKMTEAYRELQSEIDMTFADAEVNSEILGRLVLYGIKSRYNISSIISTKLAEKHKNKIIVVYEKSGAKAKMSARTHSGMDVAKLLQKAARGLKASAGGHEAAAGATLNTSDWEKFKEHLAKLCK
ncbi:MAG: DHH family phosphoesterase [Candidatus Aenigmarchaeota archaeon]|nr:DHH family phosphoesterase [Candidatus Aenigmarchaeota archaeon]